MRVKLDKVCKRIYAGGDVPKDRYSTVKTAEYAIPIYANAEKDNGLYGYTDTARENELSITVAARGTIGFTAIRREPFLPVVRLITVVPDLSTVSERYLYYALRNCKPAFSGTSIPQLTVPDIKKNEIELYSLSVQETIADKLDAVGRIIELRQQQLQKLDELVKARFVEMFGDPLHNTKDLQTSPMTNICRIIDGDRGKNYPKQEDFSDCGFCLFLNAKNVTAQGFSFENCMYITKEKDALLHNGKLCRGDVVLTTRGTIGNLAFYDTSVPYGNVRINSGMVILRMNRNLVSEIFFMEQFKMQLDSIKSRIASGSAQPQLPISTMNKIKMILPQVELQKQFEQFVKQVDKSKVAVQKSLDEAQLLFDSLMQQYFE